MPESVAAGPIEGRCICGAVSVNVKHTDDARIGVCHCRLCQRWSGALFACFAVPAESLSVSGKVVRYASSDFAERAFCPKCGSHLWMRDTKESDGIYDLMPGLFDATRSWPLRSEIYCDRALASVCLAGDHRRATRSEYEAEHPHVKETED